MSISPLLKALSGAGDLAHLERIKDDDADPGLGSWLAGDQSHTFAPAGVPGLGGAIAETVWDLLDHTAIAGHLPVWAGGFAWIADWFSGLIDDWLWTGIFSSTGLFGAWWAFRLGSRLLGRQRRSAEWKTLAVPTQLDQAPLVQAMQAAGIRCAPGEPGYIWVNAYHMGIAQRFLGQGGRR